MTQPNELVENKLLEIKEFWNQPTFDISKRFHDAATTVINSARLDIDTLQYKLQQTREELDYAQKMYQQVFDSRSDAEKETRLWKTLCQERDGRIESLLVELEQVKAERDKTFVKWDSSVDRWNEITQIHFKEIESLRTELSAKDKVLRYYASLGIGDVGMRAESILYQYKGEEQR